MQKFAVFSSGDDAFSLDANAARPTLNLTSHVIIGRIAIQQLHWILTHLRYDTTHSNLTTCNGSGQIINVMTCVTEIMSGAQHKQQFLKSRITALILVPSGLLVTQLINVTTVSLVKLH